MKADLHLHTAASDGSLSPEDMVKCAVEAGMDVIAITDHDTAAGLVQAQAAAVAAGLYLLPGVELSTGLESEVHLLGYGVDVAESRTRSFFEGELHRRRERMLEMLERLEAAGIHIAPQETEGLGGFMGRMNLAQALCAHGYAQSIREAFDQYMREGTPTFVPRKRMTVEEGVAALHSLGIVPVLAHPGKSGLTPEKLRMLLPAWIEAGLGGLEAWHASHALGDALCYERIARENGLLVTGGSDCHGRRAQAQPGAQKRRGHAWIGENLSRWRSVQEDVEALKERMACQCREA